MRTKQIAIGIILISISLFFILATNDNSIKVNTSGLSPSELSKISKGINFNNITYTNISDIPEEYYNNPEFYPSYKNYKNFTEIKQADAYGYGAYPGEISYNVKGLKAGQSVDVFTFVLTSNRVANYQGLKLSFISPDEGLFETNTEPSDILLSPFINESGEISQNWTYRIRMRIMAKKDIPEGRYVFKLVAGQPSAQMQNEYQNLTDKYTNIGMIQPGKFFDFVMYAYK